MAICPVADSELHEPYGTVVPSNPAPRGVAMSSFDNFGVSNLFYAPQVGLSAEVHYGRFSLGRRRQDRLGTCESERQGSRRHDAALCRRLNGRYPTAACSLRLAAPV